ASRSLRASAKSFSAPAGSRAGWPCAALCRNIHAQVNSAPRIAEVRMKVSPMVLYRRDGEAVATFFALPSWRYWARDSCDPSALRPAQVGFVGDRAWRARERGPARWPWAKGVGSGFRVRWARAQRGDWSRRAAAWQDSGQL